MYVARGILSVLGGSALLIWQLSVGIREHDAGRLIGLAVVIVLTLLIIGFVSYARSLPRRDLRRAVERRGDAPLVEARMAAVGLEALGDRDATGVTDVVVAATAAGVELHTGETKSVLIPCARIVGVNAAGDENPYAEPGGVLFELEEPSAEISLSLRSRLLWGAFPASPPAARRFVDTVRQNVGVGTGASDA